MSRRLSSAEWTQIQIGFASGIGLRQMARNMGIPAGTVLAKAKRDGWTKQIAEAKAAPVAQSNSIATTPLQSVTLSMLERGQAHVERMAGIAEKVVPHVSKMKPNEILESVHEVEKLDRMARRTFGLGDGTGSNTPLVNVNLLLGELPLSPSRIIEAEG
jgi:hypothetical protein